MINENYFEDAFILHDESNHYLKVLQLMEKKIARKGENNTEFDSIKEQRKIVQKDIRSELHYIWAKLRNIIKFQPLRLIRDYFGEIVAFYFAFMGAFIATLWLPSLVGIIFFIVGLTQSIIRIEQSNNTQFQINKY